VEQIMAILTTVGSYVPAALMIVGGFALLAAKTPNKSDDRIVQVILDVINFVGANFGKSKNA